MLCQQCLGDLRSKIAEVYDQCITPGRLHILQCLHHMYFALHDADRTFIDVILSVLFRVSVH